uniref:Uncharacterized protein n=1 Tax=viral metagenome TaxID=1070528 RepID=A0A6C0M2J8_9ZZZZ
MPKDVGDVGDRGTTKRSQRGVVFANVARTNSDSEVPTKQYRGDSSKDYAKRAPYPDTVYGEPRAQVQGQLWSGNQEKQEAQLEAIKEGGPRVLLETEPELRQALQNAGIQSYLAGQLAAFKQGKTWEDVSRAVLPHADTIVKSTDPVMKRDHSREYRILYFKLSQLVTDPGVKQALLEAIEKIGGMGEVGKGRRRKTRKTRRGRKGRKRTVRKY